MRPLLRSLFIAAGGAACFFAPWPSAAFAGAALLAVAALLVVEHGFLRRRTASVSLNATVFEIERPLLGRLLGYATVIAGDLEIEAVPRRITQRLSVGR